MRKLVLALAFCFAIAPLTVSAQTTTVKKHKAAKVKKHNKAAKIAKRKAVKHTAA